MVNTIARKLFRGSRGEDKVALQAGIHNLDDDLLVREADDKSVLRRIVLVLRLGDQALARIVVGLALATSAVLHLEAREVRIRLLFLHERHLGE